MLTKELERHKQELAEIERTQTEWTVTASNGNMVATAKKRGRPRKADAPYDLKKHGAPKKAPGRKKVAA